MTMTIGAIDAVNARQSDVVFFECVKLEHASLSTPLHFVCSRKNQNLVGELHIAFPFTIKRPSDTNNSVPQATITFDNTDQEIMQVIRELEGPITCSYYIVSSEEPDIYQIGPIVLTIRTITGTFQTVSATAKFQDILNQAYPGESFNPSTTPGLF